MAKEMQQGEKKARAAADIAKPKPHPKATGNEVEAANKAAKLKGKMKKEPPDM